MKKRKLNSSSMHNSDQNQLQLQTLLQFPSQTLLLSSLPSQSTLPSSPSTSSSLIIHSAKAVKGVLFKAIIFTSLLHNASIVTTVHNSIHNSIHNSMHNSIHGSEPVATSMHDTCPTLVTSSLLQLQLEQHHVKQQAVHTASERKKCEYLYNHHQQQQKQQQSQQLPFAFAHHQRKKRFNSHSTIIQNTNENSYHHHQYQQQHHQQRQFPSSSRIIMKAGNSNNYHNHNRIRNQINNQINNHNYMNSHDSFVDEADELFYYMNMFEEEEEQEKQQQQQQQIDDDKNDNDNNTISNDNADNDNIDNLIIPDLKTLLSSSSIIPTSSSTFTSSKSKTTPSKTLSTSSSSTLSPSTLSTSTSISEIIPNNNSTTHHIEQLAPAESIAYFYLQNTIGLPSDIMWKITNEAGSVLGFTVPNLKTKINYLKRIMNLTNDDICVILTKQPSILHLSSNRNISSKVLFLVRYLDLSKSCLKFMVMSYPCILCYSIDNLQKKLAFFETVLGYYNSDDDDDDDDGDDSGEIEDKIRTELRELLVQHPKLLTAAVDDSNYNYNIHRDNDDNNNKNNNKNMNGRRTGSGGLVGRYKFLHEEIGIPKHELKYIIKRNPRIILYSLQNNLQPKLISLFIMRLRMTPTQITKVLHSFPFVMDYNLENHLLPITRYFLTELEFSPMEFKSIVLKFPKIYSHSLFKIKHVVGYFRYQLGMNASQVKRILFQAPQVISLNTDETLVSKVEFLRYTFGLSQEEYRNDGVNVSGGLGDIRKVIAGMPTLLLCSVENNLRPKANYLLEQFGGDALELRQAVLTLPTLLGYSLEKRIKPRMEQIIDAGIEPIKITVGITMTEDNFQKWLSNQRFKVANGGRSLPRKQSSRRIMSLDHVKTIDGYDKSTSTSTSAYADREVVGMDDTTNNQSSSLGAIVLCNENGDNNTTQIGTGRIMHWKR